MLLTALNKLLNSICAKTLLALQWLWASALSAVESSKNILDGNSSKHSNILTKKNWCKYAIFGQYKEFYIGNEFAFTHECECANASKNNIKVWVGKLMGSISIIHFWEVGLFKRSVFSNAYGKNFRWPLIWLIFITLSNNTHINFPLIENRP